MPTPYDPARAYADMCVSLRNASRQRPWAEVLSGLFGTEPWSADFFELVACIVRRGEDLKSTIQMVGMDDDIELEAISHVNYTQDAFRSQAIANNWNWSCEGFLSAAHVGPISALSPAIRPIAPLSRLSDQERDNLIHDIDELILLLVKHELSENDFIRQLLIDGLNRFKFRIERLFFVGLPYALESIREIIGAYYALEQGLLERSDNPPAQLVLSGIHSFLGKVWETVKTTKESTENGIFLANLYVVGSMVVQGRATFGGLLEHLK